MAVDTPGAMGDKVPVLLYAPLPGANIPSKRLDRPFLVRG